MKIVCLDTETTGLKSEVDKIIEIALLTYDLEERKLVDVYVQRINPQREISASAQQIHGIAMSDLADKPTWSEVVLEVHKRIEEADVLVAHNFAFDGAFLVQGFIDENLPVPKTPSFCTMENGRWATFNGKLPKLQELCFALGVDYNVDEAHSADYDTKVMAECLFRGIDRGFYHLEDK